MKFKCFATKVADSLEINFADLDTKGDGEKNPYVNLKKLLDEINLADEEMAKVVRNFGSIQLWINFYRISFCPFVIGQYTSCTSKDKNIIALCDRDNIDNQNPDLDQAAVCEIMLQLMSEKDLFRKNMNSESMKSEADKDGAEGSKAEEGKKKFLKKVHKIFSNKTSARELDKEMTPEKRYGKRAAIIAISRLITG